MNTNLFTSVVLTVSALSFCSPSPAREPPDVFAWAEVEDSEVEIVTSLREAWAAYENVDGYLRLAGTYDVIDVTGGQDAPESNDRLTYTAVYEPHFTGKLWGSVRLRITWIGGSTEWIIRNYLIAYDGSAETTLTQTYTYPDGNSIKITDGQIDSPSGPHLELMSIATGWSSSLFGLFFEHGKPPHTILDTHAHPVAIRVGVLEGQEIVAVVAGDEAFGQALLFSPADHFTLQGRKYWSNGEVFKYVRVLRHERLTDSIWYPVHVVVESYRNGEVVGRSESNITDIKLINELPEGVSFRLDFPEGTSVTDFTTGDTLQIGPAPGTLLERLQAQVEASRSASADESGVLHPSATQSAGFGQGGLAVTGLVAFLAAMLAAGAVLVRRNLTSPPAASGCLAILFATTAAVSVAGSAVAFEGSADPDPGQGYVAADGTELTPLLDWSLPPDARVSNSGVNTAALLLMLHEKPFELDDVAAELEAGSRWERPVDVTRMHSLLEKNGLDARLTKGNPHPDVAAALDRDSLCLVMLQRSRPGTHAFLVLQRKSADEILVMDPGSGDKAIERDKLESFLALAVADTWITIPYPRQSEVVRASASRVEVRPEPKSENGFLFFDLMLVNDLARDLTFVSSVGTCDCYTGARFAQTVLKPGGQSPVRLQFDPHKFARSGGSQSVLLRFACGHRLAVEVAPERDELAETVDRRPRRDAVVSPQQVRLGRVTAASVPDFESRLFVAADRTDVRRVEVSGTVVVRAVEGQREGRTVITFGLENVDDAIKGDVTVFLYDWDDPIQVPVSGIVRP